MKLGGFIRLVCLLIAVSFFNSCMVKEVRVDCPCWLSFVFDELSEDVDSVTVSGWRDCVLFCEVLNSISGIAPHEIKVPKGLVRTCVYSGIEKSVLDGYRVMVPLGEQADSLFYHRNSVRCDDEFAVDTVKLCKHWTNVRVRLVIDGTKADMSFTDDGYDFVVRSTVCGTDMLNESPVYGTFRFVPEKSADGSFEFRIMRHDGDAEELYMDIYKDGVHVDDMKLGKQLISAGYDWSESDLSDVDMVLNMTSRDVFITVKPWVDQGEEDIIF